MFLFLDKTVEQVTVLLVDDTGRIIKRKVVKGKKDILPVISPVIKNQKISGIIAVAGPDSFSISRGKVAVANTFSFAWDIPAIGLERNEFRDEKNMVEKGIQKIKKEKPGRIIFPVYDREPNITLKMTKV
jgi:tRNA A37 threonylcarbamoyladenosine modification protein TsaB